jgi:hypothetical protein
MEIKNTISLKEPNDINENNIHKCEKCGSIILMCINYNRKFNQNNFFSYQYPSIVYRCQNNHINYNDKTLVNTYYNTLKNFSGKCLICKSKKNLFYCDECDKYFCNEHKTNDKCIIEHNLIKCTTKMNYCDLHEKNYSFYCKDCLTGLCEICFKNHEYHNYIKLNESLYFSDETIIYYENKIQECKNIIKYYEKHVNSCIKEINSNLHTFKKNNETQIKLFFHH